MSKLSGIPVVFEFLVWCSYVSMTENRLVIIVRDFHLLLHATFVVQVDVVSLFAIFSLGHVYTLVQICFYHLAFDPHVQLKNERKKKLFIDGNFVIISSEAIKYDRQSHSMEMFEWIYKFQISLNN